MRGDGVITLLLRAGMMASRLYHRERVIPALTDHLEDEGEAFGGARICGFVTLQQCLADVRGVGGNCSPSPYYQPPYYQPARRGYPY